MQLLTGAIIALACTVLGMLIHNAMLRHTYGPEWMRVLEVYKEAADKARKEREEEREADKC